MLETEFDKIPIDDLAADLCDRICNQLPSKGIKRSEYNLIEHPITMFLLVMDLDRRLCDGGFCKFFFQSCDEDLNQVETAVKEVLGEPQLTIYNHALKQFQPKSLLFKENWVMAKDRNDLNARYFRLAEQTDFSDVNREWHRSAPGMNEKIVAFIAAHKTLFCKTL